MRTASCKRRGTCMIGLAQSEIYHLFQNYDNNKALVYSLIVSLLVLVKEYCIYVDLYLHCYIPYVFAGSFTASPCPFQRACMLCTSNSVCALTMPVIRVLQACSPLVCSRSIRELVLFV
jgi:hypothetical protein